MKRIALLLLIAIFAFTFVGCDKGDDESKEKRPDSVSVRYEVEGSGTIHGSAEHTVKYGKDATTVTAVAADGWVFVAWDDGYEFPTRTDKGMTEDMTFTAIFESDGSADGDNSSNEDIPTDAPDTPEIEFEPDNYPME